MSFFILGGRSGPSVLRVCWGALLAAQCPCLFFSLCGLEMATKGVLPRWKKTKCGLQKTRFQTEAVIDHLQPLLACKEATYNITVAENFEHVVINRQGKYSFNGYRCRYTREHKCTQADPPMTPFTGRK